MAGEFHREYLVRLPLPLAQLYSRAHNAPAARARHDNTFYLFEALIKIAACPLVAAYLREVEQGGQRVEKLDRLLAQLALPSLGQWTAIVRELGKYFGKRPDAASHPLGHVWQHLDDKRRDRPAMLALYRRIKNGADGQPAGDQSCSLLQLFEAMVLYRNGVFGHGAGRFESFFEEEMGPLLFPAANEVLAEGAFRMLGPPGSRLVYVSEMRKIDADRVEIAMSELVGLQSERMAPQQVSTAEAAGLTPNSIATLWSGQKLPLQLDPLLVFRSSELSDEVLFLNRDRNGRQVEYLSYTTGRTERDRPMAPAMARLLSRITGREVSEDELERMRTQSRAETPSVETLFDAAPRATRVVGDYEILAKLGSGGMGVVYLARQLSLGRLVALKMLPADLAGDGVALARLRREMRALGRCEHPNIVKVLASGTFPDDQLYYAMEYIPGADLEHVWRELSDEGHLVDASDLGGTTWARAIITASRKHREETSRRASGERTKTGQIDDTSSGANDGTDKTPEREAIADLPLPPLPDLPAEVEDAGSYARRVARMIRDAALAVQAVHDQNIVHRDIKPANLMLTPDGSRVVLMDFGLAKGQSRSLTASRGGGFLGTLRYAAPEQLAAAKLKVGPQADVHALGVTLWEMLTRRRFHGDAEDENQLTSWVLTKDPPLLRNVDATLDRDLEAIVARATEREVERRIKTARELAEYLDLYLAGETLPIRPPGLGEVGLRWVQAHKALVTTATSAVVLVTLILLVSLFLIVKAWKNEQSANQKLDTSNTQLAQTNSELAGTNRTLGKTNDRLNSTLQDLEKANAAKDKALTSEQAARQSAEKNEALAREKTQIAKASQQLARARELEARRNLYVSHILLAHQSLKDGELGRALDKLNPTSWSGESQQNVDLRGWEWFFLKGLLGARVTELRGHETRVNSVAYSPDGRLVASGDNDGKLMVWDAIEGQVTDAWKARTKVSLEIGLRYGGGKLTVAGHQPFAKDRDSLPPKDSEIVALSDSSGTMLPVRDLTPQEIVDLLDGQAGATITLLAAVSGQAEPASFTLAFQQQSSLGHREEITCVRFSHDGQLLATASSDDSVIVRETDKLGKEKYFISSNGGGVPCIAFQPGGPMLAIVGKNHQIGLYDMRSGLLHVRLKGHTKTIEYVEFSPDGSRLASAGDDGTLRIWDCGTGELVQEFDQRGREFSRLTYGPSGEQLLALDKKFQFYLWNLTDQEKPEITKLDELASRGLAWEPLGTRVAIGTIDGNVVLYDASNGFKRRSKKLSVHLALVNDVAFSSDGRYVASASWDKTVKITDVQSDRQADLYMARSFNAKPSGERTIAFSPDGRRILIANKSRIEIRDGATLRLLPLPAGVVKEFNGKMRGLAWTPDMSKFAFAARDGRLRLAEGSVGGAGTSFPDDATHRHSAPVKLVALDRSGSLVASADAERTIKVWQAENGRLLQTFQASGGNRANTLVFSPDGAALASIYGSTRLQLWDVPNGKLLHELSNDRPYCAAFHPTGETLAIGGFDGVIAIWDLTRYEQVLQLRGHRGPVMSLAWSAKATRLVSSGGDGTVIVWEPNSGQRLLSLQPDDSTSNNPISQTALSATGPRLATVDGNGTRVTLWDASMLGQKPAAKNWYAYFARGCVQADLGHWRKAIADYSRAITLGADDAYVWSNRGWAHLQLGEHGSAKRDLNEAVARRPDDGAIRLLRHVVRANAGEVRANDDDFVLADRNSRGALSVEGNHIWARRRRNWSESGDDWNRVKVQLTNFFDRQSTPEWWLQRACGLAHAAVREHQEAERQFVEATDARADDWRSWHGLARARAERKDWSGAIEACSTAIELEPATWQLWYLRGTCRRYAKQWKESAADLAKTIELASDTWGPVAERAYVLAKLGDFEGAQAHLLKATEQAAGDGEEFYYLARYCRTIGDVVRDSDDNNLAQARPFYSLSVRILKDLVSHDPKKGAYLESLSITLNRLAILQGNIGEVSESLKTYQESLEAVLGADNDPTLNTPISNIAYTYSKLASLHLELGDAAAAVDNGRQRVSYLRRALTIKQTDENRESLASALGSLAWMYLFHEDPRGTIETADEAIKLDSSQLWIYTNLVHGYLFTDQFDLAKEIVEEHKNEKVNSERTFGEAILDDFRQFKEKDIVHRDMERIEKLIPKQSAASN